MMQYERTAIMVRGQKPTRIILFEPQYTGIYTGLAHIVYIIFDIFLISEELTCRQCLCQNRLTPGAPITTVTNPIELHSDPHFILCTGLQSSQDQL